MKTVTKQVYYCGYCRRYRLVRSAIETHERHCTGNPDRVCRWDWDHQANEPHPVERPVRELIEALSAVEEGQVSQADIDSLRDDVGGCPACMLTVLRCSGHDKGAPFHYRDEVARRERERREDEQDQERAGIESGWL